jgi:hypothetical protein
MNVEDTLTVFRVGDTAIDGWLQGLGEKRVRAVVVYLDRAGARQTLASTRAGVREPPICAARRPSSSAATSSPC